MASLNKQQIRRPASCHDHKTELPTGLTKVLPKIVSDLGNKRDTGNGRYKGKQCQDLQPAQLEFCKEEGAVCGMRTQR